MKRLFFLLFIPMFFSNCSLQRDIKSKKNLIADISKYYYLSDYTIILKTKDSVFVLYDAKLSVDGRMRAKVELIKNKKGRMPKSKSSNEEMVFISNEVSKNVVERIVDSTRTTRTNRIEFSNSSITKVYIKGVKDGKKTMVYNKWGALRTALAILTLVYLVIGLIGAIYVFYLYLVA